MMSSSETNTATISYEEHLTQQTAYLEERPSIVRTSVEGMFGIHLPFMLAEPTNPVLWLELRDLPWPRPPTVRRLRRYILRVAVLIPCLLAMPLLVLAASNRTIGFPAYLWSGGISLLSLLIIPLGDFFYLSSALSRISRDRLSGHLEMMKLTLLPEQEILNAKYAAAQLNSWRAVAIELGVRVFAGVVPIGATLLLYLHYFSETGSLTPATSLLLYMTPTTLSYFLGLFEPGWRMRTITAIGLAISSRTSEHTGNGIFTGFASVAGLHLLQILAGGVLPSLVSRYLFFYFYYSETVPTSNFSEYMPVLSPIVSAVLSAVLNYLLLRIIRTRALRYALRHLQSDSP